MAFQQCYICDAKQLEKSPPSILKSQHGKLYIPEFKMNTYNPDTSKYF